MKIIFTGIGTSKEFNKQMEEAIAKRITSPPKDEQDKPKPTPKQRPAKDKP